MRQLKITTSFTRRDEKSVEKYLTEIARFDVLSPDQEYRLFEQLRNGDELAFRKIINHNLRFVVSVAKQYQHVGMHLNDIINEGNLGLIKAVRKFDESKGFKFISYAVWWIRQSILQALNEKSRKIRVPLNVHSDLMAILKMRSELLQEFEREPSYNEIANSLDLKIETVKRCMENRKRCSSLDAPLGFDQDPGLHSVLPDSKLNAPDHELSVIESQRKDIVSMLNRLSQRQAMIVAKYYGVGEMEPHTLSEIGEQLGLSRERVRQIKDRAIQKLRLIHKNAIPDSMQN